MRKTLCKALLVIAVLGIVCLSGCRSIKAVLVHETTPLVLAKDVKAYVYIEVDGKMVKADNKVVLKEGLVVMSLSAEEIEEMFK